MRPDNSFEKQDFCSVAGMGELKIVKNLHLFTILRSVNCVHHTICQVGAD
jgi:hypothetical protein